MTEADWRLASRAAASNAGAPVVHGSAIFRERLLAVLRETSAQVVCLAAPGGYGKSTVLSQWAAEDDRPFLWVSVQPQAPDPAWVAEKLVERFVEAGLFADSTQVPQPYDATSWYLDTCPRLGAALSGVAEPFVIVLDDAGAAGGAEWDSLLASIVEHLPQGSQLAVATREDVPPALRARRLRGSLLEMGFDFLAFDALEGAELIRTLGLDFSDAELMQLLERTEGWPAAVYLGALALSSGRGVKTQDLGAHLLLADFIRDEILQQVDPATEGFLLRSSVLTELDGPACQAVTGAEDSLQRLRQLASRNHLLVPLDATAERFRMHQLLSDFLGSELRARSEMAWKEAHAAASRSRERSGDLDAAVHHAKQSGDDARLGDLVWSHAGSLLGSGRMPVLKRWINGVGNDRLCSRCSLALTASWVAQQSGDLVGMAGFQLAAEEACHREGGGLGPDVELLRATVGLDGLEQMERSAARYLQVTPQGHIWRVLAHYLRGIALVLIARVDEGIAELKRGSRLSLAHRLPVVQAHCLAGLATVSLAAGDRRHAEVHLGELRKVIARQPLDHIATTAPIFTASALGYLAEGRIPAAKQEADRALRLTSLIRDMAPWYAVQGRLHLARLFMGLGDRDRAVQLFREADTDYDLASCGPVIVRLLEETRVMLRDAGELEVGPAMLTTAEIRVLHYLPTHMTYQEIAAELFVSRYTVKTQVLAVYRKLGVHTRGEAIAKSRQLGLLPLPPS